MVGSKRLIRLVAGDSTWMTARCQPPPVWDAARKRAVGGGNQCGRLSIMRAETNEGVVVRRVSAPVIPLVIAAAPLVMTNANAVAINEPLPVTIHVPAAPPAGAPPVETRGHIQFSASRTSGNTDTEAYQGDAEFGVRTRRSRYIFGGEAHYAKDQGEPSQDKTLGYLRYDHFVADNWYLNSNASASRDEFTDLRLRLTLGLGVGYQAWETADNRLAVEAGMNYVHEDWTYGDTETSPAVRLALDVEHVLIRTTDVRVFHRSEALNAFNGPTDLLVRSRTGIRFPVVERITGSIQFNLDYNHSPPPGNQRTDTAYLVTVGYSW